jgi:prolipoprotein diacylglyceryltransferase
MLDAVFKNGIGSFSNGQGFLIFTMLEGVFRLVCDLFSNKLEFFMSIMFQIISFLFVCSNMLVKDKQEVEETNMD